MAEDLRRFLDDGPIRARRVSTAEQVWRWCRRNPVVAGLLALVLALLVGGTIAGGLAAHHFRDLARSESLARGLADSLVQTERQANELATRRAAEAQAARAQADAKAREAQAVADFLVMDLIGAATPGKGQGTQMTIGEALARADATIDARFADQPVLAAAIHYQMGLTYWTLTDYARPRATGVPRPGSARSTSARTPARRSWPGNGWSSPSGMMGKSGGGAKRSARTSWSGSGAPWARRTPTRSPPCRKSASSCSRSATTGPRSTTVNLHEALSRVVRSGRPPHDQCIALVRADLSDHEGFRPRRSRPFGRRSSCGFAPWAKSTKTTFWTMSELVSVLVDAQQYDVAWLDAERFWTVMAGISTRTIPSQVDDRLDPARFLSAATSNWARAESLFRREAKALAADLGPGNIRTLLRPGAAGPGAGRARPGGRGAGHRRARCWTRPWGAKRSRRSRSRLRARHRGHRPGWRRRLEAR